VSYLGGENLLSNRMVLFRTYNKIEPETLAKALNISTEQYLKYEEGSIVPDIATITELAKIYKVTINEFYGSTPRIVLHDNDAENLYSKKDDELEVLKFAELSIDEKEMILAYRTSENKEQLYKMIIDKK
jgi:transcriptional regulator with XRE-family HTH domain